MKRGKKRVRSWGLFKNRDGAGRQNITGGIEVGEGVTSLMVYSLAAVRYCPASS